MKKIINGKKYDTETAEELGFWCSGSNCRDFKYCEERLYRKHKTGEFFLYGEGGAMSKYAVHTSSNNWSGSTVMIPLTEEKARKWSEKALSGDRYEEIFGEVEE